MTETQHTKKCSKCQEVKSLDHFTVNKNAKDGLTYRCKECYKAYRDKNKDDLAAKSRERYRNNKEAAKVTQRKYRERNKEVKKEYDSEHYLNNKETITKKNRKYNQNNKEAISANKKEYRKNNPNKIKAHNAKRRALKKNLPSEYICREAVYKRDKGVCWMCGEYVPFEVFHEDHIIPLSRVEHRPTHTYDNVSVACPPCNLRKNNKLPEECDWF